MRRGQVSLEVLVAIVFVLVFFVVVSVDANLKSRQASELKTFLHARELLNSFVGGVESVASAGDGFFRYYIFPAALEGGINYSVHIEKGFVDLVWGEARRVSGSLSVENAKVYCLNYSSGLRNRIANNGGIIEVTCSMPDLSVRAERMFVIDDVLYVPVVNNAPVGSPAFDVTLSMVMDERVDSLGAEGEVVLEYDVSSFPPGFTYNIIVDSKDEVVESIEVNNEFEIAIP